MLLLSTSTASGLQAAVCSRKKKGRRDIMMWRSSLILLQWVCCIAFCDAFVRVTRKRPTPTPAATPRARILTIKSSEKDIETAATALASEEKEAPKLVRVQRKYETYRWRYEDHEYTINFRAEGPADGPPIMLVHGFGANVNHFRFQFPALVDEGYRVYAIDLIGFGASDKPADVPYSIELFSQLLQDFITAMNPDDPWFLAGNSIGGLCCLTLADALPDDRVRGIVLFNCSGGMTGFRYEDVPYYVRPILYILKNIVLNPAFGGKSFFANFKSRENVQAILTQQGVYRDTTNVDEELLEILLGPSDDKGAEDVFLEVFGGPPGPTPESLLPKIACPILAQWGDKDPWTPIDSGAHPATQLELYYEGPSWTLDVLTNAGHCPHDEQPERIHRVLVPWLKQTLESYTPGKTSTT